MTRWVGRRESNPVWSRPRLPPYIESSRLWWQRSCTGVGDIGQDTHLRCRNHPP